MDPTANLAEQIRIRARILGGQAVSDDVERLIDLTEALDEWIGNGGFPPAQWGES